MKQILKPKADYSDMRDAFFEELFLIASKDKNVLLLHSDQGAFTFQKFYQSIPDQIINVGIAEQNMISVAAGLALSGKKVFVHAIANFATLRCYEQIKVDLSIMNLPVTIAGISGGFTYGSDGPTHHANQDLAIMRAIPHLRILNASDTVNLSAFPNIAYQIPSPTYIRFDKGNYPNLYDKNDNFLDGAKIVKPGKDTIIISSGITTHQAMEVANLLAKKLSLNIAVLDIYQLKPLNEKFLTKLLSPFKNVITLEEHLAYGGVGTIVSDLLTDSGLSPNFLRFGLPDDNCFIYGSREFMHEGLGLSSKDLVRKISQFLSKKHV